MEAVEIKPIKITDYQVKQSKFEICGKLPIRSILLGPSGSGKTILLQNMIMNIYDKCFERVYIFSPSVNVDTTWIPVKGYIEKVMDVHETDTEKYYFDHYNPEALENIIEQQKKIVTHMKATKSKSKLFQILIIIDDFADDPSFSRHSKLLHSLYTRGRHSMISTITSTQKFNSIHPLIRVNATELYVYRLRNQKDLDTFIDEVSAILDKKTLLKLYKKATSAPYSFLYVKLSSQDINKMFFQNLNEAIPID